MYRVGTNHVVYAMDREQQAVLEVPNGATIVFETCDCFEDQITSVDTPFTDLDWDRVNPATGPVLVKGAEPGDTLQIRIEKIEVADRGVMVTGPDSVIGERLSENRIRLLPIRNKQVVFSEKLSVPVAPMIGVIGTAPLEGSIPCGVPGEHGGNMDCKIIGAGAIVYLPVNVTGALLALGDLHAAMGDGEVAVCGVEVAGKVTVTVNVIKGRPYPLPFIKTEEAVYTVASAQLLDDAATMATSNMMSFLEHEIQMLSTHDAIALLSIVGDLQICQVVDPLKTARFKLPLSALKK